MSENKINRKNLWRQLSNVKRIKVWFTAVEKLGLTITQPKGGSSHYSIRFKGYENTDIKGFICTIYGNPVRKDVCEIVFKKLLDKGFKEDEIWKALRMLD